MPPDEEEFEGQEEEYSDFVPAVFARSLNEAQKYQELLNDHDIPAIVGLDEELQSEDDTPHVKRRKGMTHGVPVLVPEVLLDEASEVIADREEHDEFETDEDDDLEDDEDEEEEEFELEEGEELEEAEEEEEEADDLVEEDEDEEKPMDALEE
jgi:hypothetical protein